MKKIQNYIYIYTYIYIYHFSFEIKKYNKKIKKNIYLLFLYCFSLCYINFLIHFTQQHISSPSKKIILGHELLEYLFVIIAEKCAFVLPRIPLHFLYSIFNQESCNDAWTEITDDQWTCSF